MLTIKITNMAIINDANENIAETNNVDTRTNDLIEWE